MVDATVGEFEKWYVTEHPKIKKGQFHRNFNEFLRSKKTKRTDSYLQDVLRFCENKSPQKKDALKNILFEPFNLNRITSETGLSFKDLKGIPGLTKEFSEILQLISRGFVNRSKFEALHGSKRNIINEQICGNYKLFRRHSTVSGLFVDTIKIKIADNDEIGCEVCLYNSKGSYDKYDARGMFDGEKLILVLTKTEKSDSYIDASTITVNFSTIYSRQAAIISGSVDQNKSVLCAAKAALVKDADGSQSSPHHLHESNFTPEDRVLYEKLNNAMPLHHEGDRVLMFDNLTLNAEL